MDIDHRNIDRSQVNSKIIILISSTQYLVDKLKLLKSRHLYKKKRKKRKKRKKKKAKMKEILRR